MKQVSRPQAIKIINTVAQQYGIDKPFELYDDFLIDLHMTSANTPCRHHKTHNPTAKFICSVELEFGIEPGDPHDVREYQIYLRG